MSTKDKIKVTKTKVTENYGVLFLQEIVEQYFQWSFHRIHLENDYGIDSIVEIINWTESNNGFPTGKQIGFQIKSGESYYKNSEFILYDKKHLDYWGDSNLPIFIFFTLKEKNIFSIISFDEWKDCCQENGQNLSPIKTNFIRERKNLNREKNEIMKEIINCSNIKLKKNDMLTYLEDIAGAKLNLENVISVLYHPEIRYSKFISKFIPDIAFSNDSNIIDILIEFLSEKIDTADHWGDKRNYAVRNFYIKEFENYPLILWENLIENNSGDYSRAEPGWNLYLIISAIDKDIAIKNLKKIFRNEKNSFYLREMCFYISYLSNLDIIGGIISHDKIQELFFEYGDTEDVFNLILDLIKQN